MDSQHAAQQFWRQGFVHLPGFFPAALMDAVDHEVMAHFGMTPDFAHTEEFLAQAQVEVVPWFPQMAAGGHPLFEALDAYPGFAELTREVLGAQWQNLYSMVMFSKKGTTGQAWHQDCAPEDPLQFNLNRLVYASPILPEIGGEVVVMPGSHRAGLLSAGVPHENLDDQVILRPGKGDLLLLHGHCWHRVLPVRDRYRYSINHRAVTAGTPQDITDVCVYRNIRYRFSTAQIIEHRV